MAAFFNTPLLHSQSFDLVILDNVMPVMTGMQFLTERQLLSQKPDVPVIMVSGWLTSEVRENALRLGVKAIIGKPYDFGELRSIVTQSMGFHYPLHSHGANR